MSANYSIRVLNAVGTTRILGLTIQGRVMHVCALAMADWREYRTKKEMSDKVAFLLSRVDFDVITATQGWWPIEVLLDYTTIPPVRGNQIWRNRYDLSAYVCDTSAAGFDVMVKNINGAGVGFKEDLPGMKPMVKRTNGERLTLRDETNGAFVDADLTRWGCRPGRKRDSVDIRHIQNIRVCKAKRFSK